MRSLLAALSLALLSGTALAQTAAPTYSSLWSLGDSLSDVGRTYARTSKIETTLSIFSAIGTIFVGDGSESKDYRQPLGPLYYKGHFSNGKVWAEYLSQLNGLPYNADRNLAWGGAVTGEAYDTAVATVIQHLEQQVGQFKDALTGTPRSFFFSATSPGPASDYGNKPLVTFWIGGNNFRQEIEDTKTPNLKKPHDAIVNAVPDDLRTINNAFALRPDVAQKGVTYYVPTVADVSTTPKFASLADPLHTELSTAVKQTNRDLKAALYTLGDEFSAANPNTRIVIIDTAALLAEVQANPTAYGFTNATQNCVNADTGKYANNCSESTVGNYLFWDQFHPTTKAHEMIAVYAQDTDWLELGAPVALNMPYVANIEIRDRTFAGTISDGVTAQGTPVAGSLIKQGESTLTLAGLNSYSGGTRIDQGTVSISSDANLGAQSGVLTLRGGAISASQSLLMQRNVMIASQGGTFDARAGATLTLQNNTLSGDGALTKTGAGVLDLRTTMNTSANQQNLTVASATIGRQQTTVAGGTLKINTTNPYISYRMDVAAGAILGGSGTIITATAGALSADGRAGGMVIAGTLAPGNSIGTLTINGDVRFTDSGVYQLEVDTNRTDHLVVNGTLSLDGTVQIVTDPTDKITTQRFTFANSGGARIGAYDAVVDMSPFLSETLTYGPNSATVQFARDFAAPATTANQRAVASYLNRLYLPTAQGDLDNVFYGLDTTGTNVAGANALDQLSGVSIGNLMTSDAIQRGQFTRAMEDRMATRRAGRDVATDAPALSLGQDASGLGSLLQGASAAVSNAGTGAATGAATGDGISAWARVMGGPGSVGGAGAYDMTGLGVILGLDKSIGNGLVGASLGYGAFNNDGHQGGNGSADSYQASLYGSWQQGALFVDGTLAYAYVDYTTSRTLAFGALSRTATGSASGNDVTLSVKAGGTYGFNTVSIEPSVGFDWYHLTRGGFTEANAFSAGLVVGSQTLDLAMPSVGLRLSNTMDAGAFTLTPEMSARYYYNFGDTNVATTAGLIGAPAAPFTVEGTGLGRNIGVLAAGLSAQQGANLRVSTRYELQLADQMTAQVFSVDLKYRW